MRAITVKQPWPYAIFYEGKDIENRSQNILLPKPILLAIHVSRTVDDDPDLPRGYGRLRRLPEANDPGLRGKIIGVVTLERIDIVRNPSIWYRDCPYAYVISNPRLLKTPLDARGYQSHWEVPPETLRKFRYQ
jgi:hypothetical protein